MDWAIPFSLLSLRTKKIPIHPQFIWDVSLKKSSTETSTYSFQIKQSASVSINPSLLRHLKYNPDDDKFKTIEEIKNNPYLKKDLFTEEKELLLKTKLFTLYEDYFEDLKDLISDWKQKEKQLSAYEIKYFNYVKSHNAQFQKLFDRYVYLKKILDSKLFDSNFVIQIERLEPLAQLEKVVGVLSLMERDKGKFKTIIPFHNYISTLSLSLKNCFIRACEIEKFESLLHFWYMEYVLDKNHITALDFNGFEKGYFNLVYDLGKINNYYSAVAKKKCEKPFRV